MDRNSPVWKVHEWTGELGPSDRFALSSNPLEPTEREINLLQDLIRWLERNEVRRIDLQPFPLGTGVEIDYLPTAAVNATGLEELLANLEGTSFDTITDHTERDRLDSWLDRLP